MVDPGCDIGCGHTFVGAVKRHHAVDPANAFTCHRSGARMLHGFVGLAADESQGQLGFASMLPETEAVFAQEFELAVAPRPLLFATDDACFGRQGLHLHAEREAGVDRVDLGGFPRTFPDAFRRAVFRVLYGGFGVHLFGWFHVSDSPVLESGDPGGDRTRNGPDLESGALPIELLDRALSQIADGVDREDLHFPTELRVPISGRDARPFRPRPLLVVDAVHLDDDFLACEFRGHWKWILKDYFALKKRW